MESICENPNLLVVFFFLAIMAMIIIGYGVIWLLEAAKALEKVRTEETEKRREANDKPVVYVNLGENDYIQAILHEVLRAEKLHPWNKTGMYKQVTILTEEAGEVAKAVLKFKEDGEPKENIKEELIQTAAMCIRMLKQNF